MSVSWGRQQRYRFSAGGPADTWIPPASPGVYAITYKQDPKNRPKSHTVLYFDEAEDLSKLASAICQRVIALWKKAGGSGEDFFVFFHPMSGSSQFDRSRIKERLIAEYQPHGNEI